ncbi:hypothetical protein [Sphingobium sp. WCS2017Hpa-17]|uniref:hypothetical protein n=1 Tax=Sphingobium sp. WCS2017Hpa-17 TaxID=3073638 RepID=UPI00288ABBD7|nr:hypothetical protein [Sphingobium sp. WCS2017Hpa-17]
MEEGLNGIQQTEQKAQNPQRQERPVPPELLIPHLNAPVMPVPLQVEQMDATEPVPETTTPKSISAPPARQARNKPQATWEAELLAHLEAYRRYPLTARNRHE